jgi:hypothetical protein
MTDQLDAPWANDSMGRGGVAQFLTKYLDRDARVRVLNINAPWGTGKTFFLSNWKEQERNNGRSCIYFNAWEADYSGDAFVSLVATIRDQLEDIIGPMIGAENSIKDFTRTASKTLVAATPALAKGMLKKFTGIDLGILSDAISQEDLADAAEKAVEKLIDSNKETKATVLEFRGMLDKLLQLASSAAAVNDSASLKPTYIFIDELDRCRPTFAIELLERIKHLFDVGSCRFIIATDTSQLSQAVRAVYGAGFDSERYLRRFFDREYSLSTLNYTSFIKANCTRLAAVQHETLGIFLRESDAKTRLRGKIPAEPLSTDEFCDDIDLNEPELIMVALAKTFNPSLRDLDKIVYHLEAMLPEIEGKKIHFLWAAYLVFLKIESPKLYSGLISGDQKGSMTAIAEQHPAKSFYFGHTSKTIHYVAHTYINLYRGGQSYAESKTTKLKAEDLRYVSKATTDFNHDYNYLSSYPTLVDLAHSID